MPFCKSCGHEVEAADRFCESCGVARSKAPAAPAAAPKPVAAAPRARPAATAAAPAPAAAPTPPPTSTPKAAAPRCSECGATVAADSMDYHRLHKHGATSPAGRRTTQGCPSCGEAVAAESMAYHRLHKHGVSSAPASAQSDDGSWSRTAGWVAAGVLLLAAAGVAIAQAAPSDGRSDARTPRPVLTASRRLLTTRPSLPRRRRRIWSGTSRSLRTCGSTRPPGMRRPVPS
jgi:predicted RNA-binding Zn-ribbon protein involved in translation (DUF1610 family)